MGYRAQHTKTDYERQLNDAPIVDHPFFQLWLRKKWVKKPRWGSWLRENHRSEFDKLYVKHLRDLTPA